MYLRGCTSMGTSQTGSFIDEKLDRDKKNLDACRLFSSSCCRSYVKLCLAATIVSSSRPLSERIYSNWGTR